MTIIVFAVTAMDDFTGSGALSGNWTHQTTGDILNRFSDNVFGSTNAAPNCAFWSADSWAATHSSKVEVEGNLASGTDYIGVSVNNTTDVGNTAFDGYVLWTDGAGGSGHFMIEEIVDGTGTEIANYSETIANNDTIKLARLSGNVLQAYKNDTEIACDAGSACSGGVVTDATFTGGSPGMCIFDDAFGDNWVGEDIASSVVLRGSLLGVLP